MKRLYAEELSDYKLYNRDIHNFNDTIGFTLEYEGNEWSKVNYYCRNWYSYERGYVYILTNELLPGILKDYPSVKVGFEGQEREQGKTFASIKKVMPIIFLLMLFVVILTFKSVSQSLILFATIPFAFIGVGLGHYLLDLQVSLFSFLGVIALVGVMVNDGLVLIGKFNSNLREGMTFDNAIFEAGRSRFPSG